jgi:endonuclease/exonuclease/phosphatase family metal-dependent hydrolase
MKKFILLFLFISTVFLICAQDLPQAKNSITIVFYNVENLFDIFDDPVTTDEEFTPGNPKNWNAEKYKKKIDDLANVLTSINDMELPGIIGFAEVENNKVLEELANSSKLRKGDYGIVHYESKDERGIDVALLYSKNEFKLIGSKPIPVVFGFDIVDVTRDILYVKGVMNDGKTCHIFVNHWPSRTDGEQESEIKRITAAVTLRKEIDNILNFEEDARIIIMGDFNDEPTNKSLLQILNATNKRKNISNRDLYNLMYDIHNTGTTGTITYQNAWQVFDQIIVSPAILKKGDGYYLNFDDGLIYNDESVLFTNPETGFKSPSRTYGGDTYYGGVSDHLPVYVILRKDE